MRGANGMGNPALEKSNWLLCRDVGGNAEIKIGGESVLTARQDLGLQVLSCTHFALRNIECGL